MKNLLFITQTSFLLLSMIQGQFRNPYKKEFTFEEGSIGELQNPYHFVKRNSINISFYIINREADHELK